MTNIAALACNGAPFTHCKPAAPAAAMARRRRAPSAHSPCTARAVTRNLCGGPHAPTPGASWR